MNCNLFWTAIFSATVCLLSAPARSQHDPGVRGGFENTAGELERKGIHIPRPPLISRNPGTGAPVQENEVIRSWKASTAPGSWNPRATHVPT
jgi:hypothetical protein